MYCLSQAELHQQKLKSSKSYLLARIPWSMKLTSNPVNACDTIRDVEKRQNKEAAIAAHRE